MAGAVGQRVLLARVEFGRFELAAVGQVAVHRRQEHDVPGAERARQPRDLQHLGPDGRQLRAPVQRAADGPAGQAQAAARELLPHVGSVTAIFAGNDLSAFGALDALAEHGIHVPRDMSVASYDNTPVAALRTVSLTTVDQFAAEIGAEAMRSVLARVKRRDRPARHVLMPPRLIQRATTALPPGAVAIPASGGIPSR